MNRSRWITLLTDFGNKDVYVGVMKGVIAAIAPNASVIDLTHEIPPQDLIAARFALMNAYLYFPDDTVHVAVVDPGVGSDRRSIAIQTSNGFLVGADNGLFGGILERDRAIAAVELSNPRYWRTSNPSTTFHGRDIFAPVGAHLAAGVDLKDLGQEIAVNSLVRLSLPEIAIDGERITGCIQYIDVFGNLITNIPQQNLPSNPQVTVKKRSIRWGTTYSDAKERELIAFVGSHGFLEIAANRGNARQKLKASVGDIVLVTENRTV